MAEILQLRSHFHHELTVEQLYELITIIKTYLVARVFTTNFYETDVTTRTWYCTLLTNKLFCQILGRLGSATHDH